MAVDDEGVWQNPAFLGSGAPEVDVDPTAVSDYFAEVAGALFDTVAAGLAETPPDDGYMFRAKNAPGAWWIRVSGAWVMCGIPHFATTGARDAALTAPTGGDRARVGSTVYRYVGGTSTWVVWDQGWTAWTPTLQLFSSLGTGGAASGQYFVASGFLHFEMLIQFGTASIGALQNQRGFSAPVAPHGTWDDKTHRCGLGIFRDVSVGAQNTAAEHSVDIFWDDSVGYFTIRSPYSGSSAVTDYEYSVGTGGGFPTLGSGDYFTLEGSYPLAGAY